MLVFKNANVFCDDVFVRKILCVEEGRISHIFSNEEYESFRSEILKKGYEISYVNNYFENLASQNYSQNHWRGKNQDSKDSKDSISQSPFKTHPLKETQPLTLNSSSQHNQASHTLYEINCHGLSILPSCIDINIFPRDKKMNAKTIHTLSKKALRGGVSTIFLNPYTTPSIDNEAMNALLESINNNERLNVFPLIPSTDSSGKLSEISTLHSLNENARAIFCNSYVGSNYLYQAMQYAKMLGLPVCVFPFDVNIERGMAYESSFAMSLGLPMITPIGQIKEVAKIKEMANFLDLRVILMSMNIPYCFDMVAKECNMFTQVGLPHLAFSELDIKNYDTRYKILPPLLTKSKKEKLLKRLADGKIDLLTSMQNAVSKEFKEQVFEFATFGLEGLEHFFSIAYTLLVRNGIITLSHLIRMVSTNASDLMKLNKGIIAIGADADFMIIDLDSSFIVNNPLSPYHNMEVYGKIEGVVVGT